MSGNIRGFVFLVLAGAILHAQEPPPPAETPVPSAPAAAPAGPAARNPNEPQPYDRVITKDAKSSKGIFTVHQIRDRYYFEIPKAQLNLEFLLNVRVARATMGVGNGGDE